MNSEMSIAEKHFLNEVLEELKEYQISSKDRRNIKQQILEHIQESREHGEDGIYELGDTTTFVKDFLEINGIDLHSEIKQIRKTKSRTGFLFAIGIFTLIGTYLGSQLILSIFLTDSFSPLNTNDSFDYNIFYRISDNSWWNAILMISSISISLLVAMLVMFFVKKK
ncbi:hypothetical protein [Bacillus sp. JJ722]|uniref:hypothetical protein n=1 Tax=Bacillus sp. JJ722 TaxID=3122973 RepID=UPI002FFE2272